jgi:glycosyltransferase involved in cell wall biosynthesis
MSLNTLKEHSSARRILVLDLSAEAVSGGGQVFVAALEESLSQYPDLELMTVGSNSGALSSPQNSRRGTASSMARIINRLRGASRFSRLALEPLRLVLVGVALVSSLNQIDNSAEYDVVVVNNLADFWAISLKHVRAKRVVAICHHSQSAAILLGRGATHSPNLFLLHISTGPFFKKVMKEYNATIVTLNKTMFDLFSAGYPGRTLLLPLGVDIPALPSNQALHESNTVLYVGRLEEATKHVSVVIRAFASARRDGWRLKIIGTGPDASRYQALAKSLGIERVVSFEGYVSPATKDAEYWKSAIFFSASSTESLGLAVLEAMAHGLPVVCKRNDGVEFILLDQSAGFIGNSLTEMTDRLRRLMDDAQLRTRMGESARETVRVRFNQARQMRMMCRLLFEFEPPMGQSDSATSTPGQRMPPVVES